MLYLSILAITSVIILFTILKELKLYGTPALLQSPIIGFSIFIFIIHCLVPSVKYVNFYYRYGSGYTDQSRIFCALLILFTYFIATRSISIITRKIVSNKLRLHQEKNSNFRIDYSIVFALTLLFFLIGAYYGMQNALSIRNNFLSDRISAGVGKGLKHLLPNFLIASNALFVAITSDNRANKNLRAISFIFAILNIAISFTYYFTINSRNSVFVMIMLLISTYFFMRPRFNISKKIMSYGLLGLCVTLGSLSLLRSITLERYTANESSYTLHKIDNLEIAMLDGAFGNDELLLWMEENGVEKQWGITYAAAIANFVPRSMWLSKPIGAGPRMINQIYPNTYVVGGEKNTSVTTGLIVESWLNFGPWGPFIVLPVWALIVIFLASRVIILNPPVSNLFWGTALFLCSSLLMYAEFTGFLARSVFILFPYAVIHVTSVRRSNYNPYYKTHLRQQS